MRKIKDLECILLIDDDEPTNFIHKKVIKGQQLDVSVQVATNGREGLDYLIREGKFANNNLPQPGIIFLDINMPVMDGWEFIEEYKKLKDEFVNKKLIFLMLTTSLNPDDMETANSHNMVITKFISKPLTPALLDEAIELFEKTFVDDGVDMV
jgi:CheY-like chemotaxis protein